jgi:hypothetical protein
VAGCIHWMICKHMELQVTGKYYDCVHRRVINVSGTGIIWEAHGGAVGWGTALQARTLRVRFPMSL